MLSLTLVLLFSPPGNNLEGLDSAQCVVFGSFRGGEFASSLVKVTTDGIKEVLVSKHPSGRPSCLDPFVCPDGRILFTRGSSGHLEEIWIMRSDGSDERQLIASAGKRWAGSHTVPTISPDGNMILYVKAGAGRGDTTVMVRALEGKNPRALGPGRYPAWSPDGKIGFMRSVDGVDELFVMADLDAEPVRLTRGKGAAYLSWSPDGSQVVYGGTNGKLDLMVISADGGTPRLLTETPDLSEWEPAWSPDGRWIAYARTDPDASQKWHKSIYIIPAKGGTARRITSSRYHDFRPAWSGASMKP